MIEPVGQSHRAEHFSLLKANRYAATVVMNILDGLMQIDSVLDLGCGLGTWLEVCRSTKHGRQVFGVEIEEFPAEDLRVEPERILNADLAESINLHRRFDLVLCLETAEHVAPSAAGSLVGTCTRHSDVILFSAALPGQGGLHHVNEQLPEYWEKLFQRHEFEAVDLIRPLVWDDRQVPVWYRQNMVLFVRRNSAGKEKLQEGIRPPPLGRAHPDLLGMLARQAAELQSAIQAAERAGRENSQILNRELEEAQAKVEILDSELQRTRADAERLYREIAKSQALGAQVRAAQNRADTARKIAEVQSTLDAERRRASVARAQKAKSDSENQNLRAQLEAFRDQTASLLEEIRTADITIALTRTSTSWRLSAPIRWLGTTLPTPGRAAARRAVAESLLRDKLIDASMVPTAGRPSELTEYDPKLSDEGTLDRKRPKIVFVSGEPDTPGHHYRVAYMADCLPLRLFETIICDSDSLEDAFLLLSDVQLLWFWRVPWSESYEKIVGAARHSGTPIFYDIDDLMFRPELARVDIIDGIRTQQFEEAEIRTLYSRIQKALCLADLCVTTTDTLAREVYQVFSGSVSVIPNGFSRDALQWAEAAREAASAERSDGLIRIGYAAGTLTHQRDFMVAASAIADLLAEVPHARLVLFKGTVDISEFPDLERLDSQIEWREQVPLAGLLWEYARFDINIAPLEEGNRFCEAKSDLKFFEAALVGVPTIASPTDTFRWSIENGVTGFLAGTSDEWHGLLRKLSDSCRLRSGMGERARQVALWRYGPERRALAVRRLCAGISADRPTQAATLKMAAENDLEVSPGTPLMDFEVLFEQGRRGESRVAVVIPLFNYMQFVTDALDSVLAQTERDLDVIVVDDCSTDNSVEVVTSWLAAHSNSFNHVALLRNARNSKLGATRNAGVHFARTELYLPLDADNVLQPLCVERLLREIDETGAAFAYPKIESFGETDGQVWHISAGKWDPNRLRFGNYIDAMALVRTACWSAVGGYVPYLYGWEDYDFWCSFAERGFFGAEVPEVLARYRYHGKQMIKTLTPRNQRRLESEITARHFWLRLGGAANSKVDACNVTGEIPAK